MASYLMGLYSVIGLNDEHLAYPILWVFGNEALVNSVEGANR